MLDAWQSPAQILIPCIYTTYVWQVIISCTNFAVLTLQPDVQVGPAKLQLTRPSWMHAGGWRFPCSA